MCPRASCTTAGTGPPRARSSPLGTAEPWPSLGISFLPFELLLSPPGGSGVGLIRSRLWSGPRVWDLNFLSVCASGSSIKWGCLGSSERTPGKAAGRAGGQFSGVTQVSPQTWCYPQAWHHPPHGVTLGSRGQREWGGGAKAQESGVPGGQCLSVTPPGAHRAAGLGVFRKAHKGSLYPTQDTPRVPGPHGASAHVPALVDLACRGAGVLCPTRWNGDLRPPESVSGPVPGALAAENLPRAGVATGQTPPSRLSHLCCSLCKGFLSALSLVPALFYLCGSSSCPLPLSA